MDVVPRVFLRTLMMYAIKELKPGESKVILPKKFKTVIVNGEEETVGYDSPQHRLRIKRLENGTTVTVTNVKNMDARVYADDTEEGEYLDIYHRKLILELSMFRDLLPENGHQSPIVEEDVEGSRQAAEEQKRRELWEREEYNRNMARINRERQRQAAEEEAARLGAERAQQPLTNDGASNDGNGDNDDEMLGAVGGENEPMMENPGIDMDELIATLEQQSGLNDAHPEQLETPFVERRSPPCVFSMRGTSEGDATQGPSKRRRTDSKSPDRVQAEPLRSSNERQASDPQPSGSATSTPPTPNWSTEPELASSSNNQSANNQQAHGGAIPRQPRTNWANENRSSAGGSNSRASEPTARRPSFNRHQSASANNASYYQQKRNERRARAMAEICEQCHDSHPIYRCNIFRQQLTLGERWRTVEQHNLCPHCLFPDVEGHKCQNAGCPKCDGAKHSSLLCPRHPKNQNSN